MKPRCFVVGLCADPSAFNKTRNRCYRVSCIRWGAGGGGYDVLIQRLATGWTVWGSNSYECRRFFLRHTYPAVSAMGIGVFPGSKAAGEGRLTARLRLAPRVSE